MDKLNTYRTIIKEVLTRYYELDLSQPSPGIEPILAFDIMSGYMTVIKYPVETRLIASLHCGYYGSAPGHDMTRFANTIFGYRLAGTNEREL